MPKLTIQITDRKLARNYARRILVGSAFAFSTFPLIAPKSSDDIPQTGEQNFYTLSVGGHRTIALLPVCQIFPGFKVHTKTRPFQLVPVLLPDKEIYRAIHDTVRLLLIADRK